MTSGSSPTIDHTLTSEADIDKFIANALAAFGALRPCILEKLGVMRRVKGMIYSSLLVSILLYAIAASAGV
jgi:DNA-binding phage protein